MTALSVALARAARLIEARLIEIEAHLHEGDAVWADYFATVKIALEIEARLTPGGHGELISTADLAKRLNLSPKTILRRKKAGTLRPAIAVGKLIRWKAEAAR